MTDDEKALADFIRSIDLPDEAPDDVVLIARALIAAGYSQRGEVLEDLQALFEQHYWDSLAPQKELVLQHVQGVFSTYRALSAPAQPDDLTYIALLETRDLADKLAEALRPFGEMADIKGGTVECEQLKIVLDKLCKLSGSNQMLDTLGQFTKAVLRAREALAAYNAARGKATLAIT